MKLLKKLSAKDILGPVNEVVKAMKINESRECYAVAGISKGYEKGMSTFGEWVRFVGDFQATNYLTGEVARASKAHVPEVLQDAILSGIGELEGVVTSTAGGNVTKYSFEAPIEFAFKVSIIRNEDDENGGISYQYETSPLTEMAENDSLSHLTKLLPPASPGKAAEEVAQEVEPEEKLEKPKSKAKAKAK